MHAFKFTCIKCQRVKRSTGPRAWRTGKCSDCFKAASRERRRIRDERERTERLYIL